MNLLPEARCPHCNAELNACSRPVDDDSMPRPGDYTVCLYCGCALMFDGAMRHVKLPQEEMEKMDPVAKEEFEMARLLVEARKRRFN